MVANTLPNIQFMSYTKKYDIINEYLDKGNKIPDNLNIIFSAWDKNWKVENPYDLAIAYVDFKNSELNPEIPPYAYLCPCADKTQHVTCSMCQACWNKKLKAVKFLEH